MKATLRVTRLENRDTPSTMGSPDMGMGGPQNNGQHGAVVCPDLHQPGEGQNGATLIYMPTQAHGGTPPPGADNGHGPTRVYDTIPNDQQACPPS